MEKTVYQYVWRHSRRQQIALTLMSAAALPFLYLFYEVPKTIINEAIIGTGMAFPVELHELVTIRLFGFDIPLLGSFEIYLEQVSYLFLLCGVFLILVVVNQAFKYVINVYKGLTLHCSIGTLLAPYIGTVFGAGQRIISRLSREFVSSVVVWVFLPPLTMTLNFLNEDRLTKLLICPNELPPQVIIVDRLPIRIVIGTEDFSLEGAKVVRDRLAELKIAYEFELVQGPEHNIYKLYDHAGLEGLLFHARNFGDSAAD